MSSKKTSKNNVLSKVAEAAAKVVAKATTKATTDKKAQPKKTTQKSTQNTTQKKSTQSATPKKTTQQKVDQVFGNATNIISEKMLANQKITNNAMDYIKKASSPSNVGNTASNIIGNAAKKNNKTNFVFNANADEKNLGKLDIKNELPKLGVNQISKIIEKHFPNSKVIKPSDSTGIFNAQQKTGMSALALLSIGAQESGYGTSQIANDKNNIWGWGATNNNPYDNAVTFSEMEKGAEEYAKNFMKTYYDGYGAKTINSVGTGDNPAKKGYAYFDNQTINPQWAGDINSIMGTFYRTAKDSYKETNSAVKQRNKETTSPLARAGEVLGSTAGQVFTDNYAPKENTIIKSAEKYLGTPYVWGGRSSEYLDCAGFVYKTLEDSGYTMPKTIGFTNANDLRAGGKVVDKSELKPGDIVFYADNDFGHATHVAIYVGNGKIIHSSGGRDNDINNPGKGVSYQNLNYRDDYLESRRY